MEYTKGEWTVEDETNIFCGDRLIATAGGYSDNYTSPRAENKANARLIAQAPKTYEWCKRMAKGLKALGLFPDDVAEVEEIHAKVEGGK